LVFGNPKNRITQNLTRDYPIALDFFKELGDFAKTHQTCLCIEPNPADYGTNFINTLEEANVLVDEVKSEGFKMIVDTSTMILNQTQPEKIQEIIANVRHIHISMPFLKPLSVEYLNYENWLKNFIFAVRKTNYDRYLSIEMLNATAPEIENSLKIIQEITHSKL
jgi:sugar phosphate isomerase/epimerase